MANANRPMYLKSPQRTESNLTPKNLRMSSISTAVTHQSNNAPSPLKRQSSLQPLQRADTFLMSNNVDDVPTVACTLSKASASSSILASIPNACLRFVSPITKTGSSSTVVKFDTSGKRVGICPEDTIDECDNDASDDFSSARDLTSRFFNKQRKYRSYRSSNSQAYSDEDVESNATNETVILSKPFSARRAFSSTKKSVETHKNPPNQVIRNASNESSKNSFCSRLNPCVGTQTEMCKCAVKRQTKRTDKTVCSVSSKTVHDLCGSRHSNESSEISFVLEMVPNRLLATSLAIILYAGVFIGIVAVSYAYGDVRFDLLPEHDVGDWFERIFINTPRTDPPPIVALESAKPVELSLYELWHGHVTNWLRMLMNSLGPFSTSA